MGEARTIEVKLSPRASRNEIVGARDGVLAVKVTAPPVGRRANEALRTLLAKELGVAKSKVEIVRGERGRHKVVRVTGARAAAIEGLLRG